MSHRHSPSAWSSLALGLLVPMWLLAAPSTASAQHTRGGGGSGGHASGRASGGGQASGGGHASGGGGRSGTQSTGTAVPRGSTSSGGDSGSSRGSSSPRGSSAEPSGGSSSSGMAAPATPHSRPRGNAPAVGEAVPRTEAPAPRGGGVLAPGGYYGGFIPWGFGGLGLYGGYYGGYYDPWFDPYYGGGYYAPPDTDEQGSVHLKVKPRDASVFVDGYYAGVVDDFDGVFQRLHVDPGPHRIEISAPGHETLSFEVRVLPGQTVTYRGELKPE